MSLRHGRPLVAIPGPSIMPERVLAAMRQPMPNIYAGELVDVADEVFARLPAIACTDGHALAAIGNGHSAWELAAANTLSRGDTVLVVETGRFPEVWGRFLQVSGIEVETLAGPERGPIDPALVESHLAARPADAYAAVLAVHVDTAISVKNDIAALGAAIAASGSDALFMVDCIASLGCDEFLMDEWGVDITIAASQKGLMTPPGMGLVWVNDRAVERGEGNDLRTGYFDWTARLAPEAVYQRFSGTPPIGHLYALREALLLIEEEGGLDAVWARHTALANAVRAAVEAWATPGGLELYITDPAGRANCVTTVLTHDIDALEIARHCEDGAGLTIGLGVMDRNRTFRIGHMGHLNPPSILGTLGTIESALHRMAVPMGSSGVAAAAAVIGAALPMSDLAD
ncbi:MAG: aminotransferase class V-fold PLP-dependent enzyme [Actinomycetota bacterium]